MRLVFSFIMIINFINLANAEDKFFDSSTRGWHWYEDRKEKDDKAENQEAMKTLTPTETIESLQQELKKRLHKAILYPTEPNIIAYINFQEKMLDKSEIFAYNWQKVIYKHPELDSKTKHPVNQAALHLYHQENHKKLEIKIKALAKDYGLIYVYKSNCIYCQKFAPVVKDFADRYNWSVLGVSLDGEFIEEFPNSKIDNGIAQNLEIKTVPALIAVNPKDNTYIPIAYGYISQQEMEKRINILVRGIK